MTTYLVVINDIQTTEGVVAAQDILDYLFGRRIWVFPSHAPHLSRLNTGDRLIIYLAGKTKAFAAEAHIASRPAKLALELSNELYASGISWLDTFVRIRRLRRLPNPRPINRLVSRLAFITDKQNYGLALRNGLRRIPEADARVILGRLA